MSKRSEIGGFGFAAFIFQLRLQKGFSLCLPRDASWLALGGNLKLSACDCIVRLTELQTAAGRTRGCLSGPAALLAGSSRVEELQVVHQISRKPPRKEERRGGKKSFASEERAGCDNSKRLGLAKRLP